MDGAYRAISHVDSALAAINGQRAKFGALQARFENTIQNLQITSENLSASRSRIRDADFAAETANLTRAQILQQAGTAVLAQANACRTTCSRCFGKHGRNVMQGGKASAFPPASRTRPCQARTLRR